MNNVSLLNKDAYKIGHVFQYPKGTEEVYSNFTARGGHSKFKKYVVFGVQGFIKQFLLEDFYFNFFKKMKVDAVSKYKRRVDSILGKDSVSVDHIAALHDLGYLPLEIKALDEGTKCPVKVPMLTIRNTKPEFYWLTNMLETLLSCELWGMCTSATIANEYRQTLQEFAAETSDIQYFVQWQGHDFSMRGHRGLDAATKSGAAHLLSFTGTDTIPAIDYLEQYYGANSDNELVGVSVPATEHSVMCMGGDETELQTFERLITEVYPSGIVSIVSDTWDFFKVLTKILPQLKEKIMARVGKVVIRPDSGDPVKIICGDDEAEIGSPQYKGAAQLLWETFGGVLNKKGFKQLDDHIGLIYGDSITPDICYLICSKLQNNGFASTNIVFGIGSYTYQYNTRDTLGFAMKATSGVIDGKRVDIFKDPKTDNGLKKSAKGLLLVNKVNQTYTLTDGVTEEEAQTGELKTVFLNGKLVKETTLAEIRARLNGNSL